MPDRETKPEISMSTPTQEMLQEVDHLYSVAVHEFRNAQEGMENAASRRLQFYRERLMGRMIRFTGQVEMLDLLEPGDNYYGMRPGLREAFRNFTSEHTAQIMNITAHRPSETSTEQRLQAQIALTELRAFPGGGRHGLVWLTGVRTGTTWELLPEETSPAPEV